jgi:hypothetical protein
MRFIAVLLITAAVGGCSADTSEAEIQAGDQVEVLELEVRTISTRLLISTGGVERWSSSAAP